MKRHEIIVILSILSMHYNFATAKSEEKNVPIDLRIRYLKHKLLQELQPNQHESELDSEKQKDLNDYVDNSNQPITPISDNDQRKLEERYKQPQLKSTTTEKFVYYSEETKTSIPLRIDQQSHKNNTHKLKIAKKMPKKSNVEIFYRKMSFDISKDTNTPQKWTHCLDLLSPFLNGFLHNVSNVKKIYSTDNNIRRLTYLLSLNMTEATTEEIQAILYEISNLPMRLFQWDVSAVKTIIAVIIGDKTHDFKGLKNGFKELFASWKLNTSNLTRLLSQSRIFRPPCIQISQHAGSTVTQKGQRFTKPDKNPTDDKNTDATKDEDC